MPYDYKHIPRYSNSLGYIPEPIYVKIPRVSDVINTVTCMFPAWQNDVNRVKRKEKPLNIMGSNYPAVRGTLTHYDIQLFIDDQIGVETDPLDLTPADNKILIQQKEQGTIDDMYDEVAKGFDTFIKWWDMYNPIPIVSEQEIVHIKYDAIGNVDPTRSLKGTVDAVLEFHLDELSKVAYNEIKAYSKKEEYEIINDKFTAMTDWKSGKDAWKSHGLQLTGYDYLLNDSGWWKEAEKTGLIKQPPFMRGLYGFDAKYGMCVKTGGKRPLTTMYDTTEQREFFLAWDAFNNAEKSTFSASQNRATGLKTLCMFCEFRNYGCPLFSFEAQGDVQLI